MVKGPRDRPVKKDSVKDINAVYETKKANELEEHELESCAALFSEHYGIYSSEDKKGRSGKKVKLSSSYYRSHYMGEKHFAALAKVGEEVVAHAFYVRDKVNNKTITWVLQLVVHTKYRRKGIGTRLLHSIWGFSDDHAWGLATANPLTVKTLEAATFRKVLPSEIKGHIGEIEKAGSQIHFVRKYEVTDESSLVLTDFYIDNEGVEEYIKKVFGDKWKLGSLKPGYEWLAFTFKNQKAEFKEEYAKLLRFSESQLREAYGRMDTYNQPWAKGTQNEIEYIKNVLNGLNLRPSYAIDMGCGRGRHTTGLAAEYEDMMIDGIDFSEFNIHEANKNSDKKNVRFIHSDCRYIEGNENCDLVLALYDVIGSFPDESDNLRIVKNAHGHLRNGGCFILSVMNMDLTEHMALKENIGNIEEDPEIIFNLRPSDTMQKSGDVFDPKYYAIDTISGLVYRKEQFQGDGRLSAEYVIRDKRYRMSEIKDMLENIGFDIKDMRYVQAGNWNRPLSGTDRSAKEILIVATKR